MFLFQQPHCEDSVRIPSDEGVPNDLWSFLLLARFWNVRLHQRDKTRLHRTISNGRNLREREITLRGNRSTRRKILLHEEGSG